MPREFNPILRYGGTLSPQKLYILGFEGLRTEPNYFSEFRKSQFFNQSGLIETCIVTRIDGDGRTSPRDVQDLLLEVKSKYSFKPTDEYWLIVDWDHWGSQHKINFEKLIKDIDSEGNFFLALSNSSFEIWLIFHLSSLETISDEEKQKLIENEYVTKNKKFVQEFLGSLFDPPRGINKKSSWLDLYPNVFEAIENAKKCDDGLERYPRQLGSHVYKLMEKLVIQKI